MKYQDLPTTTVALSVSNDKAAELIGIESPSLDKDRRIGHLGIPYVKAGRRVLYSLADLKEWLDANKSIPSSTGENNHD
jgi:hypothetical protein